MRSLFLWVFFSFVKGTRVKYQQLWFSWVKISRPPAAPGCCSRSRSSSTLELSCYIIRAPPHPTCLYLFEKRTLNYCAHGQGATRARTLILVLNSLTFSFSFLPFLTVSGSGRRKFQCCSPPTLSLLKSATKKGSDKLIFGGNLLLRLNQWPLFLRAFCSFVKGWNLNHSIGQEWVKQVCILALFY